MDAAKKTQPVGTLQIIAEQSMNRSESQANIHARNLYLDVSTCDEYSHCSYTNVPGSVEEVRGDIAQDRSREYSE